jgi:hypothetical protein
LFTDYHEFHNEKGSTVAREEIWPLPTTLQEKLYRSVDALQKTTRFVAETEIQPLIENSGGLLTNKK